MNDVKSILLVGVGGQGTILASKILTQGLIENGYDVKMSEVHGMSQRSGSVSTQVRFGTKVYSPIIGEGTADILVSFEEMEAARYAHFLKKDGKAVVNTYRIPSMPILTAPGTIPMISLACSVSAYRRWLSMRRELQKGGKSQECQCRPAGALVKAMGLTDIDWDPIIDKTVKPAFIDVNRKAFAAGMAAV